MLVETGLKRVGGLLGSSGWSVLLHRMEDVQVLQMASSMRL